MMNTVVGFAGVFLSASIDAGEPLDAARDFLEKNRVYDETLEISEKFVVVRDKISLKADPGTKFGYVVFSIARHSEKLLSEEQARAIDEVIEARKNATVNWHDVRNVVRVHAQIRLWKYAAETDPKEAAKLKADWKAWNDLRLAYMFQEYIAQERFQRAAWDVLTAEQKEALLTGDWDSYLKKGTGHGRLFSANKQVMRVLGKADHEEKFAEAVDRWEKAWGPVLESYQEASLFQRKREFSMDDASEAFTAISWGEYVSAFREFSESEAAAIREIAQSGYTKNTEFSEKMAAFQAKLKSNMVKKYEGNAASFLQLLGVL